MEIDQLRRMAIFARVVEAGSFAQAARELALSPSVVTQAVQALERQMGARLLARTTRSLALTEAGRAFHDGCARMVDAARDAFVGAARETGEVAGRLTVSASITVAPAVARALAALTREHPRLVPELRVEERIVDLVREPVDLAIRTGWLKDASIVARKLAELPERLVATPDCIARLGRPARPEELAQHRLIHLDAFARPGRLVLADGRGRVVEVDAPAAAITNSVAAAQALCLAGAGIARLPLLHVQGDLAAGRVVEVLPGWRLPDAAIYAITLQRTALPRKVTLAIAAMRTALGGRHGD